MMDTARAFAPDAAATVNINVNSSSQSSQSIQLTTSATSDNVQVRVMNDGTVTVWVAFGGSAVTAANMADIPVGAGAVEVFNLPKAASQYAAAIAAGSTGKIYFTTGRGL